MNNNIAFLDLLINNKIHISSTFSSQRLTLKFNNVKD